MLINQSFIGLLARPCRLTGRWEYDVPIVRWTCLCGSWMAREKSLCNLCGDSGSVRLASLAQEEEEEDLDSISGVSRQ